MHCRDNDGDLTSPFYSQANAFLTHSWIYLLLPLPSPIENEISSMQKSFLTFGFSVQLITEYSARKYDKSSHSDAGVYLEVLDSENAEGKTFYKGINKFNLHSSKQ